MWVAEILKKFAVVTAIVFTLAVSGCGVTAMPIPSIPGASTANVVLYIKNDGSGAILDGTVERGVDKHLIERYVRQEFGINSIVNLISVP